MKGALPLYHSRDMERSPNQMPLMLELRELAATRGDAFKEVWVALAMIGVHYCGLQPWRLPNPEVLAAMPSDGPQEVGA